MNKSLNQKLGESHLSLEQNMNIPKVNFRNSKVGSNNPQDQQSKSRINSILKRGRFSNNAGLMKTKSLETLQSLSERDFNKTQSCENIQSNMKIKQEYMKNLEYLNDNPTQKFHDLSFPPHDFPLSHQMNPLKQNEQIKWKRISELFDGRSYTIWTSAAAVWTVRPSTVYCPDYLLKGLNCIRTNRFVMRTIFETQKVNPEGIYFVKIFHNNHWKYEIIDDYIPVISKQRSKTATYRPLLSLGQISRSSREPVQIWMYLLEKAYAKYYGGYDKIIGPQGNIFDFLCELTGYDFSYFSIEGSNIQWKQFFKQPQLIALGDMKNKSVEVIQPPRSTYDKITFFTFSDRKVQKNSIWVDDLGKIFEGVFIWGQKIYSNWVTCQVANNSWERVMTRSFTLLRQSECCISIYQKDRRFFDQSKKYEYCWIRVMLLLKEFNGGYRWIDGNYSDIKSLKMQNILEEGEYYILIIPQFRDVNQKEELSIVVKTNVATELVKLPYEEGMLEEGCADLAQRFGRLNQLNTYICSYNCVHESMGMIIENVNNEKRKSEIKIVRSIVNLEAKNPIEPWNLEFQGSKELEFNVKPNRYFTVVLMMKEGVDLQFFQNFSFKAKRE